MMKPLMERRPPTLGIPAKAEPEQMRQLSPTEREWKQRIYDRLLKILDLSLLGSLEENVARNQIREITTRLLLEELRAKYARHALGRRAAEFLKAQGKE